MRKSKSQERIQGLRAPIRKENDTLVCCNALVGDELKLSPFNLAVNFTPRSSTAMKATKI
jgi:hypothetical protein